MSIPLICPHCHHKTTYPDGAEGEKATCPHCKIHYLIPFFSDELPIIDGLPAEPEPAPINPAAAGIGLLLIFGGLGSLAGGILLVIRSVLEDTTVAAGSLGRVHNLGLLQAQQNGIFLGSVAIVAGLLSLGFGLVIFLLARRG